MTQARTLDALLDQTGWIHALARTLVADPHLAADLAQDTCVEALGAELDSSRSLRGWLATVMRNRLSNARRGETHRASRERRASRDEAQASALEVVERAETHKNVVLAVLALEEPYRTTLLMRFFEQLPYSEIAERTDVTRASVNSRVTRGLERLRQRLETTYGGDRRALSLALLPLATPARTITTFLGVKAMHLAIGTTAAALVAVTLTIGLSDPARDVGRASSSPAAALAPSASSSRPSIELSSARSIEPRRVELEAPLVAAPASRAPSPSTRAADDTDLASTVASESKVEVSRAMWMAPTTKSLSVNTTSGDIELVDSAGGQLEIQATVRASAGSVGNRELARGFDDHVEVVEEDGVLRIQDKHRDERGWNIAFLVRVPSDLAIGASSGSGDIVVRRAHGNVTANTGSGDVKIALASERVQTLLVNTGSGDIQAEVASIEGKLAANTGSGDVTLRVASASLSGSTSLNTGSGDIGLVVPANITGKFDLETHGEGIDLPSSFGIQVQSDAGGKRVARGSVGGGSAEYTLRSGSGGLAVKVASQAPIERR